MVWPIQQQRPMNGIMPHQKFFPGRPPQQPASKGLQQFLSPQASQSLLSPERLSGFSQKLTNVQQVLNVVQHAAPIVQQYGPMVKNLPMLFKLMKALNEDDADENAESENKLENEEEAADAYQEVPSAETEIDSEKPGESTPKLFI